MQLSATRSRQPLEFRAGIEGLTARPYPVPIPSQNTVLPGRNAMLRWKPLSNPNPISRRIPSRAPRLRRAPALCVGIAAVLGAGPVDAQPTIFSFGAADAPTAGRAVVHGAYAAGCLAGARRLAETGPGWQAMRLSRNRNWGHPEVIAFIERLSRAAQDAGWAGLYVGDISQPRGGPMTSGHVSHQIGLDADIWLRPPRSLKLSVAERETIGAPSVVATNRLKVNSRWTDAHSRVLEAAARDPSVARIFVNAAIKRRFCESSDREDAEWMRKVRPWWGHDSHFHVRLRCPDGEGCVEQDPPPPGDGCDATLAWWFTDEVLNPPPPDPGYRPPVLTLADLPSACRAVVGAE